MEYDEAVAAQRMMMGLSDERPGRLYDDGLGPVRALVKAQADALAGRDDDGPSVEWGPF